MINFCRKTRTKNDVHHVHDILHSLQEIFAMCPLLVTNAVHQSSLWQNPRICSLARSKECSQTLALQLPCKMFTVRTWVHLESSHELSMRNWLYVFLHSTTSVREGSSQGKKGMNQRFLERKLTMWTPTMTAATVQQERARQTCTTYSPAGATLRTQTITGAGAAQFAADPVLRHCTPTKCSTQQRSEAFATQGAT